MAARPLREELRITVTFPGQNCGPAPKLTPLLPPPEFAPLRGALGRAYGTPVGMAISLSGSTSGAFLGAGPVAGAIHKTNGFRRLIGEGKSIYHRHVIRACDVAHTLNTLLRERS